MKIEELNLNKMIETKLKSNGKIYLVEQLVSYDEQELLGILSLDEINVVKGKLEENGLCFGVIRSVSEIGLDDDIVSFLRDGYIHTLDELLLSKSSDISEYKDEIDFKLSENNLKRVSLLSGDDKLRTIDDIKYRNNMFIFGIYEYRLYSNRNYNNLKLGIPFDNDSVKVLGGKCDHLEAMGYKTIGDLTSLTRKEFLDLSYLLDEDLLSRLHYLGYECMWETREMNTDSDKGKYKSLFMSRW